MRAIAQSPAAWGSHAEASPAQAQESFWRSLFLFNVYRLIVALILLTVTTTWRSTLQFGSRDLALFVSTSSVYALFSVAFFALIKMRWRFNLQLSLQVCADVLFIVLLTYASNGISSGLGLLLLSSLAGAGLMSRGRLALFHAALGSIGILLEHTYEVLKFDASLAQFAQAGLLSGAYFATAWVAYGLAKRALASERLAAQREVDLQDLAQVNQHVIQDMQDGVLVVDSGGLIRQANARAERLLGSLRGHRDVALADYCPSLAERFAEWGQEVNGIDAYSQVPLGRNLSARFVPVSRRRAVGALIFVEDLTRIQAEARQMKLAALGRLTGNLAHEIRNPLSSISHATELLQEESNLDETTRRLLGIVQDNAKRLDRMVNEVLWLNRGSRAHRESFDVGEYVLHFADQFSQVEKLPPGTISVELRGRPRVLFDKSHLDQVMWNLCRNAVQHGKGADGSIQVAVSEEPHRGTVTVDVTDDGPGVPGPLRNQLFEPFFTTSPGGTGLGLYIAREVCEANGAQLEYVDGARGAHFTVICKAG